MSVKVSIVMSVYNAEEIIKQSIDSILNQTFSDYELIIIDDHSSDKTTKVIERYIEKYNNIKLIKNEKNIGLTKSLINGINKSQGIYIARLDAGDIMYPTRLEQQVKVLDSNQPVGLVSSYVEIVTIDEEGKQDRIVKETKVNNVEIKRELCISNPIPHYSVMFKKEDYYRAGEYDADFKVSQDYELWVRLLNQTQGYSIPKVLTKSIVYKKTSITLTKNKQQIKNGVIIKYRGMRNGLLPFYPTIMGAMKSGIMLILPQKINNFFRANRKYLAQR